MNQDNKNNNKNSDLSSEFKNSDKQTAQIFYPGTPKVVQWVIKYSGGLVRDEKQASYVLIGFVAAAIIISLFLFFGRGNKGTPAPKPKGLIKEGYYPELYHEYFPNR